MPFSDKVMGKFFPYRFITELHGRIIFLYQQVKLCNHRPYLILALPYYLPELHFPEETCLAQATHQIGGFSQQQSAGGTLSFSSQYGLIYGSSLPVVSLAELPAQITLSSVATWEMNHAG